MRSPHTAGAVVQSLAGEDASPAVGREGADVSTAQTPGPGGRTDTGDETLREQLADYRHVREQLERSVLPLATSVDGVHFRVHASLYDLALKRGGYVALESGSRRWLGQITDLAAESVTADVPGIAARTTTSVLMRRAEGIGLILDPDGHSFHDASVRPAEPDEVRAWFAEAHPDRAGLVVGELLLADGVPAVLDAGGLNRHTFMCGQSGSGKTYSLGLLLEKVLAETSLRIVVLDPNSDYVGLGRIRDDADRSQATRYAHVPGVVRVWGDESADRLLRLRFADLDSAVQAAVLDLDPIRDREEFAVLLDLLRTARPGRPLISGPEQLLASETESARRLGRRALNLGVLDWEVWSQENPSLIDELRQPSARCTIVDLGSLGTVGEARLVAEAVLSTLWSSRHRREPCLVVIDEAHNICPAEPHDPVSALSTEQAVQIAAEGRKYGLYLLVSTQRPHKVHENVVSQCDNLLLMRMNSEADLADLSRLFSFVPPGLMAGATAFGMGQALVGGRLFPRSGYVRMGRRVTHEGGVDLPTSWADAGRRIPADR
jgi:DNA helicase HerA-like ATPase